MKGVQSDVAAKAIKRSCLNMIDRREKEKAKAEKKKAENPEFPLSSKQRGKLSGSGAPNYTLWTDSIYNGNTDIEIISITLAVTINGDTRLYREYISYGLSPLSTGPVQSTIPRVPDDMTHSWYIESAMGRKISP